jgi:hypothetical protein
LLATPDVLTALRTGSVDARVLVVLAGLTVEHTVRVDALTPDQIVVARLDDWSTAPPEVAATLAQWLHAQPAPFIPSAITSAGVGVTVSWSLPTPTTVIGP